MISFYSLSKQERTNLVSKIQHTILTELKSSEIEKTIAFFSDNDTYIRKTAYLSIGRIYFENKNLQSKIIRTLDILFRQDDFKIRETVINAVGEIGKADFKTVQHFFDI